MCQDFDSRNHIAIILQSTQIKLQAEMVNAGRQLRVMHRELRITFYTDKPHDNRHKTWLSYAGITEVLDMSTTLVQIVQPDMD